MLLKKINLLLEMVWKFWKFDVSKFYILIGLDIIFIFFHLFFSYKYSLFDLNTEHNLPVVYQGSKLVLLGGSFFLLSILLQFVFFKVSDFFWFLLSIFLILIGLDELAQIHENLGWHLTEFGVTNILAIEETTDWSSWIEYYKLLFFIPGIFFVWFILDKRINKSFYEVLLMFLGVVMITSVIFIEFKNSQYGLPYNEFLLLILLEESFELFGASFLCFLVWVKSSKKLNQSKLT